MIVLVPLVVLIVLVMWLESHCPLDEARRLRQEQVAKAMSMPGAVLMMNTLDFDAIKGSLNAGLSSFSTFGVPIHTSPLVPRGRAYVVQDPGMLQL